VALPPVTPASIIELKEMELQEEEDSRRKELEGKLTAKEIDAILEAEYGRRRSLLQSKRDALKGS
jgi:hypothetical protein